MEVTKLLLRDMNMPLSKFNVHYLRVINPDDENKREYRKQCVQVTTYRPQDAEQQVRESELRQGFGFIRGKVKVDLSQTYAKRGKRK